MVSACPLSIICSVREGCCATKDSSLSHRFALIVIVLSVTGTSFRDTLHFKYKSSTKAKTGRRKKLQKQAATEVDQFMKQNSNAARHFEQVTQRVFSRLSGERPLQTDGNMPSLDFSCNWILLFLSQLVTTKPLIHSLTKLTKSSCDKSNTAHVKRGRSSTQILLNDIHLHAVKLSHMTKSTLTIRCH